MLTRRFPEPRGLDADTPLYCFYARLRGEDRRMLQEAHRKAAERLGDTPSNAVLLRELLEAYVRPVTA